MNVTRLSLKSITTSAIATPTKLNRLTRALTKPVWRSWESASTSVVMRVMIRPAISRS